MQINEENTRFWVLALSSVASLMVALDATIVATALHAIATDLNASVEELEWTINAYVLSFAVLLLSASALGERFGRRRMFTCGLFIFTVASAACALAPSIGWLIAARVLQGVGAAITMPLALAHLGVAFPPERRAWAMGIYSAVTAVSSVIGPVVGGAITEGLAWQWIFWFNLPVGLVAAILARTRLPESFGSAAPIDFPGVALATGGSLALVWGLVRGNAAGWTSVEVTVALLAGALLLLVFVTWERRAAAPMMPLRLFRSRAFRFGNAVMFLINGTLMGSLFFMAQYQQVSLGQGPLDAGLRVLPWGVALVLAAPRAVKLGTRFGNRATITMGLLVQATGLAWMAWLARPGQPFLEMVLPMLLAGGGFAVAVPLVQMGVMNAVAPSDIGKASGTFGSIRQLGGAFGVAITVAAFAGIGSYTSPAAFARGYAAAMTVAALLSTLGALCALRLTSAPRTPLAAAPAKT